MKCTLYFLIIIAAALVGIEITHASNVILNWDASISPNVTGYHVYYGTTAGNYPYTLTTGNTTTITISNLTSGVAYYFVATACGANGTESVFSSAVRFVVPSTTTVTTTANKTATAPVTKPTTTSKVATPVVSTVSKVAMTTGQIPATTVKTVTPIKTAIAVATKVVAPAVTAKVQAVTLAPARPAAVVITQPALVAMALLPNPNGPTLLQFAVEAGHSYEVQATTDFRKWTSIWQSSVAASKGSMQFADPDSKSSMSRFYRLVSH
jgi:hypothetical protein